MRKLSKKEIQATQLNILLAFDEFCKKNNLKYYLCGGTLLGAIRHKGFIPWDDDIDIFLPRPDYERLKTLTKDSYIDSTGRYEACSLFPCKNQMRYPFIKIVDNKTLVKELARPKQFMKIWIDVFPVDGISDDYKEQKKIIKRVHTLRRWYCSCTEDFEAFKTAKTFLKRFIPKIILHIYGIKRLGLQLDKLSSKYDFEKSNTVAGILWGYGIQECLPKEGFIKSVEVDFEGHKFPAPACWDKYLSNLYGDYMQLPPVEKRISHDFDAWELEDKDKESI